MTKFRTGRPFHKDNDNHGKRDESTRLAELKSTGLVNSSPEERFDRLTRLARLLFKSAYVTVSFVDDSKEWFKSVQGGKLPASIDRSISPVELVLRDRAPVVLQDITHDPRFTTWSSETAIRFYAAYPVFSYHGHCLGAVTIADTTPRPFTTRDASCLGDLAALVEDEVQLQSVANVDDLTKLFNRRGFLGVGEQTIAMCRRMSKPATVMFFDIDDFKAVNDSYGHAEGDKVLKSVGGLMSSVFRHSDVIARMGGDEFCVLLAGTGTEDVDRPLENFRESVSRQNTLTPYDISCSVGVVEYKEAHSDMQDLLKEADHLMYENKYRKKSAASP